MIVRVYKYNNAARCLPVKGKQVCVGPTGRGIQATIDSPVEEAMEAIGGKGDTTYRHCNGSHRIRHGDYEGLYRCCKSKPPGRVLCSADSGNPGDGNHPVNTESA